MTPAVREITRTRGAVYDSLGIDRDKRMILLSASGSGIGTFLLDTVLRAFRRGPFQDSVLVVSGLRGVERESGRVIPIDFERDNQDLVAAASLVISTAGKSTIDEARSSGTPIIAIPIKNHYEQERNARSLGFSYEDLGRMDELMDEGLRRGRLEPGNFRGAEAIASHLIAAAEVRPSTERG
jgi:UDP-N-acetylglucosamine--N-acetylmuramyl-(pentapeptide) pyrophosphoryl-undecaprenol N-acetylglucosamine transferase